MLATSSFAMGFAPQLAVQSTATRVGAVSMQVRTHLPLPPPPPTPSGARLPGSSQRRRCTQG